MTSFSLTYSVFKLSFLTIQSVLNHLIESSELTKRIRNSVNDAEVNLKFVREQERNEAEDLRHF